MASIRTITRCSSPSGMTGARALSSKQGSGLRDERPSFSSGKAKTDCSQFRRKQMFRMSSRFGTLVLAACLLLASVWTVPVSAQTRRSPVAPNRERVETAVREAYEKFRSDTSGKNADYIPYLAQVDSKLFGIAVVTTDNQVFELGDVKNSFSIQSIPKVYTL